MPNDGDLVDLLAEWVPDETTRKRILTQNPLALTTDKSPPQPQKTSTSFGPTVTRSPSEIIGTHGDGCQEKNPRAPPRPVRGAATGDRRALSKKWFTLDPCRHHVVAHPAGYPHFHRQPRARARCFADADPRSPEHARSHRARDRNGTSSATAARRSSIASSSTSFMKSACCSNLHAARCAAQRLSDEDLKQPRALADSMGPRARHHRSVRRSGLQAARHDRDWRRQPPHPESARAAALPTFTSFACVSTAR